MTVIQITVSQDYGDMMMMMVMMMVMAMMMMQACALIPKQFFFFLHAKDAENKQTNKQTKNFRHQHSIRLQVQSNIAELFRVPRPIGQKFATAVSVTASPLFWP